MFGCEKPQEQFNRFKDTAAELLLCGCCALILR